MSRTVIHDLVLPIVLKRLQGMGVDIPSYAIIHDETIEDFLDEQLSIILGTGLYKWNSVTVKAILDGIKLASKVVK